MSAVDANKSAETNGCTVLTLASIALQRPKECGKCG